MKSLVILRHMRQKYTLLKPCKSLADHRKVSETVRYSSILAADSESRLLFQYVYDYFNLDSRIETFEDCKSKSKKTL